MAGKNFSSSQPQSNSIPIDSNTNLSIPPEMNFDFVEFPLLNASSSSARANPRSETVDGGEVAGDGSGLPQQTKSLNWLKGLSKPKEPVASMKLAFNDTQQIDGASSAVFESGELKTHINNCDSYVVGYFVGRRPSFPIVKETLKSQWEIKGEFSMTIYGQQAFFFKFVLDEDRDRVLEMGSARIEGKLFLFRPWSPFIEQKIGALSSVPIWMNVTGIPFHLWNELGFSRIASIVGTPIMTDSQTALKSRMSYAKICVEVDANCTYPSVLPFYIDKVKYEARAEYPWKPKACSLCKRFGHASSKCSSNPISKHKVIWVPKAPATEDKSDSQVLPDLSKDGVSHISENVVKATETVVTLTEGFSDGGKNAETVEKVIPPLIDLVPRLEVAAKELGQPADGAWTVYSSRKNKKKQNKQSEVPTSQTSNGSLNQETIEVVAEEDNESGSGDARKDATSLMDNVIFKFGCEQNKKVDKNENPSSTKEMVYSRKFKRTPRREVESDEEFTSCMNYFALLVEDSSKTSNDVGKDLNHGNDYVNDIDDLDVGSKVKVKSLAEIPRRIPLSREQEIERIVKAGALLGVKQVGKTQEEKKVHREIMDRQAKERTAVKGKDDTASQKLGRGKRTPVKKKLGV